MHDHVQVVDDGPWEKRSVLRDILSSTLKILELASSSYVPIEYHDLVTFIVAQR